MVIMPLTIQRNLMVESHNEKSTLSIFWSFQTSSVKTSLEIPI